VIGRRIAVWGFANFLLAAAAVPAGGTDAARPAQLISFVGYASDLAGAPAAVYAVRADGRGLRKVADASPGSDPPAWAPNGRSLVVSGPAGLVLLDANGHPMRTLTASATDREPAWSPDGRWVAFLRRSGSRSYLLAVRSDGSGLRQLTHAVRRIESFAWAPDARRLLVGWTVAGELRFGVVTASRRLRVLRLGPCVGSPAWSPDGREVAFAGGCRGRSRIGVEALATGRVRWLTHASSLYGDEDPAWSPDGRRIAFARVWNQGDAGTPTVLMTVRPNGAHLTPLGQLGALSQFDEAPQWSPDGRYLLFDRDAAIEPIGEYVALVVMNVKTLDERTLYAPIQRRTQVWLRSPTG
jgi:Tol biopolymer transport system component